MFKILLFAALTGQGAQAYGAPATTADVPKVQLADGGYLEAACRRFHPRKPDPAAMAEIASRLPQFQQVWNSNGAPLLDEMRVLVGRPFSFRETVATLHACPDIESMSEPLLIAAARYTAAAGGGARATQPKAPEEPKLPPAPLSEFVYSLWHEVAHRYISDIISSLPDRKTPIQGKYRNESPVTLNHLHMFAIERVMLGRLGRLSEYDARRRQRVQLAARFPFIRQYVRAHEIVDAEGAEALVDELRSRR